MKRLSFGLGALLLSACAATPSHRAPASADGVLVALSGQPDRKMADPGKTFAITSLGDSDAIESLRQTLLAHGSEIALREPALLDLRVSSVQNNGGLVAVRFEQQVGRHKGSAGGFDIPVSGAGVVAILRDGQLREINSSLENPPAISFVFKNPGFDISGFDDLALKALLGHLAQSAPAQDYFARAARDSKLPFDLDAFRKLDFEAQKEALRSFFGRLGPVTTMKALLDLAHNRRLALVRYGDTWMFEVTGLFNIPVQFDMDIATNLNAPLKLKNYRELVHAISVNVISSPNFPNGPNTWSAQLASVESASVDRSTPGGATAGIYQDVVRYFENHFRWVGYNGSDPNLAVNVFTGLTDKNLVQNAAWVGQQNLFVIGAGGSMLTGFDRSPSTLGHEYAHAITQNTSGLVYRGETGALNEHFSDVQGVTFQAEYRHQPFNYTIGDDVLTDDMRKVKALLIALDVAGNKLDANEFQKYNALTPSLRNMYHPREGITAQPESVAEGSTLGFGPGCQPNQNNDNCGVHTLSGIPNRAVALIIAKFGVERTRNMLFRTNTMRLNAASDFQDYVRQMYRECISGGDLDDAQECPYVIEAFKQVGVNMPDGTAATPPPPPRNPEPAPQPQPQPLPVPQSPVMMFCGWISIKPSGNITVIDNKFDAAVLVSPNYTVKTTGDFQAVYQWPGNRNATPDNYRTNPPPCGCVWGRLSQTANSAGTVFNYFLNVTQTRLNPVSACLNDPKLSFK